MAAVKKLGQKKWLWLGLLVAYLFCDYIRHHAAIMNAIENLRFDKESYFRIVVSTG